MASKSRLSHLGVEIVEDGHDPTIDIVFVHGLMGHPRDTWTGIPPSNTQSEHKRSFWQRITTKEPQSHAIFWPKEFLPQDVPYARVITYGYEAKVIELFKSVSQISLHDISRDILHDLQGFRGDSVESSRPILWIAHSLGGIVALSQSHDLQQKQPNLFDIYSSTIGIIYLGTPHRGSGGATLGGIAATVASYFLQSPNKHLLRSLKSSSAELERISDIFSLLPRKTNKEIQEFSFQEDRGMASAVPLMSRKVVPDRSSKLDDGVGNTSSIAANHRDMCKFVSPTSRDYLRVLRVIKGFSESKTTDPTHLVATSELALIQPRVRPRNQSTRAPNLGSYRRSATPEFKRRRASSFDSADTESQSSRGARHRTPSPSYKKVRGFFELPLLDNTQFTGREHHLKQLNSIFESKHQADRRSSHPKGPRTLCRAILIGLGGCGKTEIALKYARLHRDDYTAVIWVDGTSPETLDSSFNRISHAFPTPLKGAHQRTNTYRFNAHMSTVNLPKALFENNLFDIKDWLRNSLGYSWLAIIDNVDDQDMIEVVEQLIVNWHLGHVIITSRNQEACRLGTAIPVSEMELSEATKFLLLGIRQTRHDETTKEVAGRLATKLGNLPLAIDQAAAYINFQQMSMDEYLLLLEEEQAYLLGHSSRNRYHKTTKLEDGQYDTVLTTWEISFRHIRKTHRRASLLLQLFAFMNPEEISEIIFSDMANRSPWHTYGPNGEPIPMVPSDSGLDLELIEVLTSHNKFREAMGFLLSFSLVRRKAQSKTLSIHPLVHFWASWRMESGEKSAWILRAAAILNMTIPVKKRLPPLGHIIEDDADTRIIPHIQTIFEFAKDRSLVQPVVGLEFLFAYGSYHTPHPTSHEMFDFARYLALRTQSLFLELLVTGWGAATLLCKVPPCCSMSEKLILLTLESLPKDSQAPEPWLLDNKSPALNALYLRLAFNLEQIKYEGKKGNRDYQELRGWIVRNTFLSNDSTKVSRMSTERVMLCWRPTSLLVGDLEAQASMLQDLSNITFGRTQVELGSLEKLEARLMECFKAFHAFRSLHEPIFAALSKLSLTPGCPFNSSLEACFRILELSYTADILRVWAPLAEAAAEISIRAGNSSEKSDVKELFGRLKKREDDEKIKRQGAGGIVTDISDSTWASFLELYSRLDSQMALVEARKEILYFLLNPNNRSQALGQMFMFLPALLDVE